MDIEWTLFARDTAATPEGTRDFAGVFNAIVAGRVKNAVNKALQAKGYKEVTSGTPDFLVSWHGAIEGKMSYSTIHNNYGYGWGWYGRGYGGMGMGTSATYVNEWDEGTLIVGIVDPQNNELIWWGSANGELSKTKRPADEAQRKAAVPLAEPELDEPGIRSRSQGLRGVP